MTDCTEQKDEMESLFEKKEGHVIRFKHRNGKIFFCTQCDSECDELLAELEKNAGKTIEQQMENFYLTESIRLFKTAYGDITDDQLKEKAIKLSEYDGVVKLILKDDILVGAIVRGYFGNAEIFPGRSVCVYYACDNEGSGYNEREDYLYLIYVNFES